MEWLDALIAVLPANLGATLLTCLYVLWELSGVASWFSAAIKAWVLPRIARLPKIALVVSFVVHVLDWLALNGPKLRDSKAFAKTLAQRDDRIAELLAAGMELQKTIAQHEQTIARQADTILRQLGLRVPSIDDDEGTTVTEPLVDLVRMKPGKPDNNNGTPSSGTGGAR